MAILLSLVISFPAAWLAPLIERKTGGRFTLGVVAQRLVRKLCIHCREFDGQRWVEHGCPQCGQTGYQGRVGVYELLLTTADIRAQIHNQVAEADIRKSAQRNGMQTLRMDGERWLKEGVTSEAELLRVTKD